MTRFLLDMNVLIELIDPAHVQYDRAHEWCRATFDARLVTDAVINGPKPLHLIR